MFTWICPQCGREVPPSYTECPDCAAREKASQPAPAAPSPQPPQQQPVPVAPPSGQAHYQPSPQSYAQPQAPQAPPQYQQQPQYAAPPFYAAPPPRAGLPTWLMSVIFALAFGGVVFAAYFAVQYFKSEPSTTAQSAPESAPASTSKGASKGGGGGNALWKQIEVVGLRLTQNKAKKTEVTFIVVNHSGAEIQDLAATVNLQARTTNKDEEPVGAFSFKVTTLGPYESKEMTAVVNTKLKVYELPDWQNLDERIRITSP
jgi:hypothetical protein